MCIYRVPLGRRSGIEPVEEPGDDDPENSEEAGTAFKKTESTPEGSPDGVQANTAKANSEHFEKKVTVLYPPRSFCPSCGNQLSWYHNLPVISWLMLMGRCGFCKTPIPMRYPLVELLSATLCWLSYFYFGLTPTGFVIYVFLATLLVISFIDYDYYIIPNVISYPGTTVGLLLAIVSQFTGIFSFPVVPDAYQSALGVLGGAGVLWFISEAYFRLRGKDGLGLGDVKLLMMIGALLGLPAAAYTVFIGSVLGSLGALCMLCIFGRKMWAKHIPFGPYLAMAAALYIFVGWYKTLIFLGLWNKHYYF